MGRKSTYRQELADEICERLAAGESLRAICRDDHMPSDHAVRLWALRDEQGFASQYARARDLGLDALADEVLAIADDGSNDWTERKGKAAVNAEHVARSRLRVDARRWYLSKLAPKRYGDRVAAEVSGPEGGPIPVKEMSETEIAARISSILALAEARKRAAEGCEVEDLC